MNRIKMLTLTIIVGQNRFFELIRCLQSVSGPLFDQIILINTGLLQALTNITDQYPVTIYDSPWEKDFSKARNLALKKTQTPYVMWLDSDDVIKPDNYRKLLELKKGLMGCDVVILPYAYQHDNKDRPSNILPRERIWRTDLGIEWIGRIHEATDYQAKAQKVIRRDDIFIDHYPTTSASSRNLEILEEEYKRNSTDLRTMFYYGRDLLDSDEAKGIEILREFVDGGTGSADDLVAACKFIAMYYSEKRDWALVKRYCLIGLSISQKYAELYVLLSNVFFQEKNYDLAIRCNEAALTKKLDAEFSQLAEYYLYLPAINLSILYDLKGNRPKSLIYNEMALKYNPEDPLLLNDRSFFRSNPIFQTSEDINREKVLISLSKGGTPVEFDLFCS